VERRGRVLLATLLVSAPCALAAPTPQALRDPLPWLEAALDPALRVPHAAALLGQGAGLLAPGERVLEATLLPAGRPLALRDRAELYRSLRASDAAAVRLHVARGSERRVVTVAAPRERGLERLARAWPLGVVAAALLVFGLAITAGSAHPCAAPLFAVSWCLGTALVGELDRVLPEAPGWLTPGEARARLGALGWTLLPASFLHLAMRFPVVSPRFRAPRSAALPYAAWLLPAGIGQLRLHDALFQGSLERIALGAALAAALLLCVASATAARRMKPIERARTGALIAGVGLGFAGPAVLVAAPGRAPGALVLTLLALPGALAWAIVRYRLLDPSLRFQRALLGSATGLLALLAAACGVAAALSLSGVADPVEARRALSVGLAAAAAAQLLQLLLRSLASGRMLPRRAEGLLERAARQLAEARTPGAVVARAAALVQDGLGGVPVATLTPEEAAGPLGPLAASGLALWRGAGAPLRAVVRSRSRSEDPAPGRAELVVPLRAEQGSAALLVVGGRASGMPYTDAEARLLEGLRIVAATALGAAATAADLEAGVREKTADLARGLRDRQRVLEAAKAICGAEDGEEVLARLAAFAGAEGGAPRFAAEEDAPLVGRIAVPGCATRHLAVDGLSPERARELAPQLDALCVFAGLALARLGLLAELKREVERQAAELAEIRSRRLHAEFVRGVAHELRKPVEEVRQRVESLAGAPRPVLDAGLGRLRALGHELARRLDLLLFHSGIRLDRRPADLARLADEAVAAARAVRPDRDYWVFHEPPTLPVLGDPSRLLSVIENLLDNAVKATRPGQRITLRSWLERARPPTGPRAVIEVEDEGAGIDAERAARIFEPGVSFLPGGFGLGLSLCREIVRLHAGTLELESRPGRTVFRVRIPLFASAGEAQPA
jgi:signal transduction histidine kinase